MPPTVAVVPCRFDDGLAAYKTKAALTDVGFDGVYLMTDEGLGPSYLKAWSYIAEDCPDALAVHVDVGHSVGAAMWVRDACPSGTDIVIGSRFVKGGSHEGSWKRRQMSRIASASCRTATFGLYRDWTSGLRAYSPRAREVLARVPYTTTGHAWQMESLWHGFRNGLAVTEIPIPYQSGKSSLDRKRMMEGARLVLRMAWSSPPSFGIRPLT